MGALTFPARFPNIFVDYPLGQMRVEDKLRTNWNKAPLKLWQTQLNYAVFCALSACRVSSAHLNYTKHPMIRLVYRFHVYYHVSRVLKRLQVPLPHETSFNMADNPYTESEFLKICEDYGVPNDPMRYRDEKFRWTYQHGVHWPNDYLGPDSMTRWIIETSVGFTDVVFLMIPESVRAYAYLILSFQASARSSIVGNMASSLTARSAFLNNFENVNHRVDIHEDIKHYQDTLSYALSKVDYSVGEHLYILPSDMTLKISWELSGTIIKFSFQMENLIWEKTVNLVVPAIISHKTNSLETPAIKNHKTNSLEPTTITTSQGLTHTPAISQKNQEPKTVIHN